MEKVNMIHTSCRNAWGVNHFYIQWIFVENDHKI